MRAASLLSFFACAVVPVACLTVLKPLPLEYCPARALLAPPTRDGIAALLEREGFKVGAELGVQTGFFAEHNLRIWKSCITYYLVDVWASQSNYNDAANKPEDVQEKYYRETQQRMAPFGSVPVILRNFTKDAVQFIPDNSLDFVYVDARHDFCGVKEDIALYWPKVRPGGIMAGHDYLNSEEVGKLDPTNNWSKCASGAVHKGAVKGAVAAFAYAHRLTVATTYKDGPFVSWLVRKPCRQR